MTFQPEISATTGAINRRSPLRFPRNGEVQIPEQQGHYPPGETGGELGLFLGETSSLALEFG